MKLIENGNANGKLYISLSADATLKSAADSFAETAALITGVRLTVDCLERFTGEEKGVAFATFEQVKDIAALSEISEISATCKEGGFLIKSKGDCIYVLGKTSREVYFGAHDLLEKNADVVWCRGAKESNVEYIPSDVLRLQKADYTESSPFSVRTWNLCGVGSEGKEHADDGTVEYIAKNKCNGVSHRIEEHWRKYGIFGAGVTVKGVGNLDELAQDHPEYFMTAPNGGPMPAHGGWDSFLNYYEPKAAEVLAERLVAGLNSMQADDVGIWVMPDNPYFCMIQDGKRLHELPFTADDGTTVYPQDKNYRSTVYFNFLNRAIRYANALRPNTYLQVFAYTYSEEAPEIEVNEHLIVTLAPIQTNDKYAYTDSRSHDNDKIRENIERWSKKTNKLGLYMYWSCFKGTLYTRPIAEVVKDNLLWFQQLGVYQVEIEGKLDCSKAEDLKILQQNARKFYDMNEAYVWLMNKLMWNPKSNTEQLLSRYCKIVYKECAEEMRAYFSLLKEGWDKKDALVWYTTGGDVYYLQFIINAGLADKILATLKQAVEKATTGSVKRKVTSIYDTVSVEIAKYKDFVKEEATVAYCGDGAKNILSKENLDYIHTENSPWNKTKALKVLRDYGTMAFYPKEAEFSCRMLYDDENIYIGYTVFDDKLAETRDCNGVKRVYRDDGSELVSYTETYIGGNVFNQSVYYGYISGFMGERDAQGQFYENPGSPQRKVIPEGVRDVKYVHLSDNPKERYYFHVQVLPFTALGATADTFTPYGSFVYYTDRYGRAGWMGYGLWSKQNFAPFKLLAKAKENE